MTAKEYWDSVIDHKGPRAGAMEDRLHTEGNCLTRSQPDEPVFVLVARDVTAADFVRAWADRVESATNKKIADARACADQMDRWRAAHGGGKLPD